ncbi:MAG TPA: FAD-dependent oxidoreductase [Acidimicrobiia bacterium]
MIGDDAAFPMLDDAEIALLDTLGTRRRVTAGETLYRAGDATYDFFAVTSGVVEITTAGSDGTDQVVVRHDARRFLGELNLLTGLRVFVTATVVESGEVIAVPAAAMRRALATEPALSDKVLAAFIARRAILMTGAASAIRLVGSRLSPESLRIREFLARAGVPHEWLDTENDPVLDDTLQDLAITAEDLPVVIAPGAVMRNPTIGEVASYLGLTVESLPERKFDLVIVGGGPAGLAAAVYGATEGLETLGLERATVGGQAGSTSRIENYLGFPMGVSGTELTQRAIVQAEKFGAHLTAPCSAASLRECSGHLVVHLEDGTEVVGRAVIVASGVRYRRLDAQRIEDFEQSVYYAATENEMRQCSGSPVVIVGGGNSAGQAALYLAQTSPVTIAIRGDDIGAAMSSYLVDRVVANLRITVRTNTRVTALDGDREMRHARLATPEGDVTVPCEALFSFIGAEPNSDWLSKCAAVDEHGFIRTDLELDANALGERWDVLGRRPLPFETSHPGLFAVGDVRSGSTKRVAAAVGEGSAAVRSVHEYLAFAHS